MTANVHWALAYARRIDIEVGPAHHPLADGSCSCRNPKCGKSIGKHPRHTRWQQEATTDPVRIRKLWEPDPLSNIFAPTGRRFDVLDIDHGDLLEWQDHTGFNLPETWRWLTGSGNLMAAFVPAAGLTNAVKRVWKADVRASGGLVILPPSVNRSGVYRWIVPPGSVPLATWPDELLTALRAPPRPAPSMAPPPDGMVSVIPASLLRWAERGAPLGQQTHCAFWLACRLRQYGANETDGWAVMECYGAACTPPANRDKLARIWLDSIKYQGFDPGQWLPAPRPAYTEPLPDPRRREWP